MKINIKKHLGIVLILVGLILTMDKTIEFNGIVEIIATYIQEFWPVVIVFLGIYLLSNPKKSKK
ncbi:MAG: hypothetical protein ACK5LC_06340 [Coprobacillaceae bacterium]